jgi:hypothetical protein
MERIKDFLSDISDLLIALLLIAVITTTIIWKVTDSLDVNIVKPKASVSVEALTEEFEETEVVDITDAKPLPGDAEVEAPPQETGYRELTIEIVSGSTGYGIAKQLREAGLIADVNEFVKRVEALGLGAKLRSGTFTLNTAMSNDEIIKKISGQ